ncbi:MAG TPA: VOC family protein [Devosia sp.]|nr:VOC family protein [Devosia sp.]
MSGVIDHVGLKVADFERAFAFYREALGTLGIKVLSEFSFGADRHAGFGKEKPDFWIGTSDLQRGGAHVAFLAGSRAEVDAFHSVALSMGGRDNGGPGLRAHYHPHYYAAFVFDLDGNNIEAVCHKPAGVP